MNWMEINSNTHIIHGAGIYANIKGYIDDIHVTIYSSTMDPSWDINIYERTNYRFESVDESAIALCPPCRIRLFFEQKRHDPGRKCRTE